VDEGSGEVVVMLHGNPTWSFLYRKLIKRLSRTFPHSNPPPVGEGVNVNYRCIAPDHIGFGLSDKPGDWNYLPEEHA
jgi:haloalkane dehalogenase